MIIRRLAFLAVLLHLFAGERPGPLDPLVKAVPVATLAFMVLRSADRPGRTLAGAGMAIAALADFVIEFSFLGGLATFLVAHLFYIGAFTSIERALRLSRLVPVLVWAALALPVLVGHAGALAPPVLVYGVVIFTMIWRAAALVSVPAWNRGAIALVGALLFGISDTLLGYSRFVGPLPGAHFLIMGTYWGGQTLIAVSWLRP